MGGGGGWLRERETETMAMMIVDDVIIIMMFAAGGVSLTSGEGDNQGQVSGESQVHIQELVIQMDPQQLSQALVIKNEGKLVDLFSHRNSV